MYFQRRIMTFSNKSSRTVKLNAGTRVHVQKKFQTLLASSLRDNNAFQVIEVVTVVPGWYFNGVFTLEEVRRRVTLENHSIIMSICNSTIHVTKGDFPK